MNCRPTLTRVLTVLAGAALAACTVNNNAPNNSAPNNNSPTPASSTTTKPTHSASTTTSAPAPSSSTPRVGGMTSCTKEHLAKPASEAARVLGAENLYTIDALECADGWAVTSGLLSSKQNPNMGAPTSFVFEQEGQFWIVQDKAKVCGTNPTGTTPPPDAKIPAALFVSGCAPG